MNKFTYPSEPIPPFQEAHPAHAYGGHAARSWGSYSTLTIHEATALSFGMNPVTANNFWKNIDHYGSMHISLWEDHIIEIIRAVYAGEIRLAQPTTEISESSLVFTADVEKYFQDKHIRNEPQNPELGETERKTLLGLLLGMAIDKYGYNPNSDRNKATGSNKNSIHAGIQLAGLNISDDTIRKYLNEAKELFPEAKAIRSES